MVNGSSGQSGSSFPSAKSPVKNDIVQIHGCSKTYIVNEQEAGAVATLRGIFHRKKTEVPAVDDISFSMAPGEIVGFLGPNGAGKTTTLKMLSGLLYPTRGNAVVLGHIPWNGEKTFLRQITLVMVSAISWYGILPPFIHLN